MRAGELGQPIVNETQTTTLAFEFYVRDTGFYILAFEPIITRPTATVTLNVQLD